MTKNSRLEGTIPLSPSDTVRRCGGLVEAEIDGEVVMLSVERGTCYGLNRTGSRIWNLTAEPMRVGDLCARLVGEFDVEEDTCRRQVADLLEALRAEGMIALVPQE